MQNGHISYLAIVEAILIELYCLNAFDKLHLKHDSFSFILKEIKIGIQE